MVLPGGSDITTVSTEDAANSRRCRSVTPQQGGRSDITASLETDGRTGGTKEGRKEGRGQSERPGTAFWLRPPEVQRRKCVCLDAELLFFSVAWFFFPGDRGVCHREEGAGQGAVLPPPSCIPQDQHQGPDCSSPLPKNIKTALYIYTALYTRLFLCLLCFFFTVGNHKSIEK